MCEQEKVKIALLRKSRRMYLESCAHITRTKEEGSCQRNYKEGMNGERVHYYREGRKGMTGCRGRWKISFASN